MITRLGKAILRLSKWSDLVKSGHYEEKDLEPHIIDCVASCKKYMAVIKSRKDEFVKQVQTIDTGGMPEYLIMESLTGVCLAITVEKQKRDGTDEQDDFDPYANPVEDPELS